MNLFIRFRKLFRKLAGGVSWRVLGSLVVVHLFVTWGLLRLAGESELTNPLLFVYYYMVVISTVGFGDFSPGTGGGRLVVSLFQIPFGILIFGATVGKTMETLIAFVRMAMQGSRDLSHLTHHILLFGWEPGQTKRMIDLILSDHKRKDRKIVLCVTGEMSHPLPEYESVLFARMASFTDQEELKRVGVPDADRVIIKGVNDEETLAITLGVAAASNPEAHICAYFSEIHNAELVRQHCPQIEVSSSKEAEILVRSMQDPGASQVQERLFSTLDGQTLFRMQVPPEFGEGLPWGRLLLFFKETHDVTLIAAAHGKAGEEMRLNPPTDRMVGKGEFLYYIAPERLLDGEIQWGELGKG